MERYLQIIKQLSEITQLDEIEAKLHYLVRVKFNTLGIQDNIGITGISHDPQYLDLLDKISKTKTPLEASYYFEKISDLILTNDPPLVLRTSIVIDWAINTKLSA